MHQENIQTLYQTYTGHPPKDIEPLAGAGSNRNYYRLKGNPQLIGVYGTSEAENRAFLYMAQHFEAKGLPVPHVYAQTDDAMAYLQEDLGDISLFQAIGHGRTTGTFSNEEKSLLKQTSACFHAYNSKERKTWISPSATRKLNSTGAASCGT